MHGVLNVNTRFAPCSLGCIDCPKVQAEKGRGGTARQQGGAANTLGVAPEGYCPGIWGVSTLLGLAAVTHLLYLSYTCAMLRRKATGAKEKGRKATGGKRQRALLALMILGNSMNALYLLVNPFECHLIWSTLSDTILFTYAAPGTCSVSSFACSRPLWSLLFLTVFDCFRGCQLQILCCN